MTDGGLAAVAVGCPNFQHLNIYGCFQVTVAGEGHFPDANVEPCRPASREYQITTLQSTLHQRHVFKVGRFSPPLIGRVEGATIIWGADGQGGDLRVDGRARGRCVDRGQQPHIGTARPELFLAGSPAQDACAWLLRTLLTL